MRILVVATKFPALSETFILSHVTGLIDSGCDVEILARRREKFPKNHPDVERYALLDRTFYLSEIERGKFKRLAGAARILVMTYLRRPEVLKRALDYKTMGRAALTLRPLYQANFFLGRPGYDVVHCHYGTNGILAERLKEIGAVKGKLVVSFHGYDLTHFVHKFGAEVYRRLFSGGDLFLPVSQRFKDELIRLGCGGNKIRVHHMGVDIQRFGYSYGLKKPEGDFKLLSVGRLVEKKGFRFAIEAVARMVTEHPVVTYDIIGDGPLRKDLQHLIADLKLAGRVRLLGWETQEEVIDRMAGADLFLAPSVTANNGDQEGIPVALMEAMALGTPVLATAHSGIPELVKHGTSGYLVREGDVDALASALVRAIQNPVERSAISLAARRRVEEEFDLRVQNRRLLDLYRELIASSN